MHQGQEAIRQDVEQFLRNRIDLKWQAVKGFVHVESDALVGANHARNRDKWVVKNAHQPLSNSAR
jgi:hypothetical protein